MHRFPGSMFVAGLLLSGCGESRLVDTFADSATRLRVDPDAFLGEVACEVGASGALQSYVVTLEDVTPFDGFDAGSRVVGTSPQVECNRAVTFPAILNRRYAASIQGFDTLPTTPDPPQPRWGAECGRRSDNWGADAGVDPFAPTVAVYGRVVPLRGCTTLREVVPSEAVTRISVRLTSALGDLECGTQPGQVSFFRATLGDEQQLAACGQPALFEIGQPAVGYRSIGVTAFEALSDAGTAVTPDAGPAPLPPPSQPDASIEAALDAGPDAADADITVLQPALPSPLDAGSVAQPAEGLDGGSGNDVVVDFSGVPRWSTSCSARVIARATVEANCSPLQALP